MMNFGINNIAIIDVKRVSYPCIIHGYRTSELINLLGKSVLGVKGSV